MNEAHPFSADRPISSKQEDLLGRSSFVQKLAQAINGWRGKESLVIALSGSWGSGKTSIKNLLLESIESLPDHLLETIDFNPWQWSAQDQLAYAFFEEIGITLGKKQKTHDSKKRALKWRAYALKLKAGAYIANGVRKFITLIFGILAILGLASSFLENPLFKIIGLIIGIASVVVIGFMSWFGEAAERVAAYLEARSNYLTKTLPELKKELRSELSKTNQSVLVIIDDIDRLDPHQTNVLFQLVKANADFPNIIYLLLFHRDIVEKILDIPNGVRGSEFLEKIVQVWFDVPIVERSKLEKVFFAGLDRILETENLVKRFDQNRWANIYFSGMRTYFKTIRDVHRYLSTLSFYAGLFKNKESSEVNPVDLMVIEVLRLFEQKVYSELPTLKRYLTGEDGHGSFGYSRNSDEVKKLIESVIAQAPLETRKTVQELIKQLFPTVEWALGGSSYSPEFTEQWYRELRICHPNVFDRYFQLSIPEGELSQSEIDTILSACGNREQFVKELKRLNENGMLGVALNRLEAYKQEIDLSMALSFTTAIFDIGDELPENQLGFVSTGYDMHAIRLVYWNLKRDTDHKRRVEIIKQAVEQTTGLFLPVMYTSIETDKKEKENDPDSFRIEGDDLLSLIQSCVNKISKASSDGSLLQNSNLGYLLHRWLDWGDENVVKPWARDIISNQDGLLRFLTAFEMRSSSQGSGDVLPKIHYKIHLPSIERFIEISQIAEKVREINTDNLSPEYQRVIQSFLRAVKRRTEGKPDDRWRDDD